MRYSYSLQKRDYDNQDVLVVSVFSRDAEFSAGDMAEFLRVVVVPRLKGGEEERVGDYDVGDGVEVF